MRKKYICLCLGFLLSFINVSASEVHRNNNTCRAVSKSDLKIELKVDQFYFLRHGVTDWNKDMLTLGPLDLSLNERGINQIIESLALFDGLGINKIITSHLKRCVESAHIISEYLGDIPVIVDHHLEERNFGNWATDPAKIKALIYGLPEGPGFFVHVHGIIEGLLPISAETDFEFRLRVVDYFNNMPGCFDNNTLIVSHGCLRDVVIEHLNISENYVGPKEYAKPIFFKKNPDDTWSLNSINKN